MYKKLNFLVIIAIHTTHVLMYIPCAISIWLYLAQTSGIHVDPVEAQKHLF
jgi:hypothetical protein